MLLDSNVLIDYLNGNRNIIKALEKWRELGFPLFISTITVSEVLSLPTISSNVEIENIKAFLESFKIVSFDVKIAEISALLRRAYNIKLPDAAIVATAMILKQPLATRDKGMRKVREIKLMPI